MMNKYQIQIEHKTELKWDWMCIYANSDEEAILKAKNELYDYQTAIINSSDNHNVRYWKNYYKEKYKGYDISVVTPIFSIEKDCEPPNYYDTIYPSCTDKENNNMAFFNVNWNDYTEALTKIAAPEIWSNNTYPNNGVLTNYIVKTYEKLQSERNIIFTQDYALFNTGLFTKYYEPIYAYQSGKNISFLTDYELGNIDVVERPDRANYFENPELLLFDWHCPINIQYSHILDDVKNRKRIPEEILSRKDIINTLNGSIDTMKKRVSCNYKLAIPQYFEGKIQLLLPLCLKTDDIPDIALTVTKKDNYYQGHTCLTLDMAYNNARLIAKPESNWLSM